jgi:hypothetical protein
MGAVHTPFRILTVVTAENIVKVWDVLLECEQAIEKLLGNHSEKFSLQASIKVLCPFSERLRNR